MRQCSNCMSPSLTSFRTFTLNHWFDAISVNTAIDFTCGFTFRLSICTEKLPLLLRRQITSFFPFIFKSSDNFSVLYAEVYGSGNTLMPCSSPFINYTVLLHNMGTSIHRLTKKLKSVPTFGAVNYFSPHKFGLGTYKHYHIADCMHANMYDTAAPIYDHWNRAKSIEDCIRLTGIEHKSLFTVPGAIEGMLMFAHQTLETDPVGKEVYLEYMKSCDTEALRPLMKKHSWLHSLMELIESKQRDTVPYLNLYHFGDISYITRMLHVSSLSAAVWNLAASCRLYRESHTSSSYYGLLTGDLVNKKIEIRPNIGLTEYKWEADILTQNECNINHNTHLEGRDNIEIDVLNEDNINTSSASALQVVIPFSDSYNTYYSLDAAIASEILPLVQIKELNSGIRPWLISLFDFDFMIYKENTAKNSNMKLKTELELTKLKRKKYTLKDRIGNVSYKNKGVLSDKYTSKGTIINFTIPSSSYFSSVLREFAIPVLPKDTTITHTNPHYKQNTTYEESNVQTVVNKIKDKVDDRTIITNYIPSEIQKEKDHENIFTY